MHCFFLSTSSGNHSRNVIRVYCNCFIPFFFYFLSFFPSPPYSSFVSCFLPFTSGHSLIFFFFVFFVSVVYFPSFPVPPPHSLFSFLPSRSFLCHSPISLPFLLNDQPNMWLTNFAALPAILLSVLPTVTDRQYNCLKSDLARINIISTTAFMQQPGKQMHVFIALFFYLFLLPCAWCERCDGCLQLI